MGMATQLGNISIYTRRVEESHGWHNNIHSNDFWGVWVSGRKEIAMTLWNLSESEVRKFF